MILRGQRAWGRIKATAAEQRQLWREVGEALNYGRALNPKNDGAFDAWCTAHGFVFAEKPKTNANIRVNAMWLADHWSEVSQTLGNGLTNPADIRTALREHQASRPAALDASLLFSDTPSVTGLDLAAVRSIAPKVVKLANHAAGVGQE